MDLAIYGAGGLGRELLDLAEYINKSTKKWNKIFFVIDDEYYNSDNACVNGADVLPLSRAINEYKKEDLRFIIAQGEPLNRKALRERIEKSGYELDILIHPSVEIPKSANIGSGTVIKKNSIISCNVNIKSNAIIQNMAVIGHDSVVGEDSVISDMSVLAGNVIIGDASYIGISSCIREKTTIGSNTVIGMGSVVVKDIENGVIAYGNPARVVRKNNGENIFIHTN